MSPCLLVSLCGILFFFALGDRCLSSSHEARAAQNGQSILLNDDWLLPQLFDRQVELQKPPLYYWLVAWFGWLNGGRVDAWAVRLPAALSALGCVLVVYGLCRRRGRPVAGLLTGCVLATFLHFTWLARVGRIDMPLTFTTTLALACFYLAHCRIAECGGRGVWRFLLPAYAALGLGLLLKGPIALALPGATFAVAALGRLRLSKVTRARPQAAVFRALHDYGLWWGIPLVLFLAAPWYFLVNHQTNGDLFRVFFWYHNFARGFGGEENLAEYPWWFYGVFAWRDLLPWSILLPAAAWFFVRHRLWRQDGLAVFGLLWLLSMTALLSCMQFKRADYLLPAYPGAALFLGCTLETFWQRSRARCAVLPTRSVSEVIQNASLTLRACVLTFFLTVVACVVGWGVFVTQILPAEELGQPNRQFAAQVRQQTKGVVLFFRVEAHDVAFDVGPPVATILEWENLERWLQHSPGVFVIMPEKLLAECPRHLQEKLRPIVSHHDLTAAEVPRPLVLVQALPSPAPESACPP